MTDELDSSFFNRMSSNIDNEIVSLTKFYNKIRPQLCNEPFSKFCVDMTNLFDGKSRMFADFRHPNALGYNLIAASIYSIISS